MKLSEVVKAIENDTFENDMDEKDHEVMILVQDSSDKSNILERGIIKGDDDKLSSMLADRMVKNKSFCNVMAEALRKYLLLINKYPPSQK